MVRLVIALLLAGFLCPFEQSVAQTLSPDEQIRQAIASRKPNPEATRIAKDKLNRLASIFRVAGGDLAANHLQHFLGKSGVDLRYSLGHPVSEAVATYDDAAFSHNQAHQYALRRILPYFAEKIRMGIVDFPGEIPLSDLGFTQKGQDRLQGPNVYKQGAIFNVPVYPSIKLNMAAGFGDFQGPHSGIIRNVKVVEGNAGSKQPSKILTFDVEYTWNDCYTFNNDQGMSDWDAAAYYLEFIAKEAKSFNTSVMINSSVRKVVTNDANDDKNPPTDGGQPGTPQSRRYQGVLKVPKDVPAWITGKVDNVDDVPYDIDGGSTRNRGTVPGQAPGFIPRKATTEGSKSQPVAEENPSSVPSALTADITADKLKNLSAWRDLLSFRPSEDIQRQVHSKGESWTVHRVEDGSGDVNLDYYPISVEKLPMINGKEVRAEVVLEYIRRNLNSLVDNSRSAFAPFKLDDQQKWNSNKPQGSILQIDIELLLPLGLTDVPIGVTDLAMVVVSQRTSSEWVFSTVRGGSGWWAINDTDTPGAHPVSGNRAFGFRKESNGTYTFYTMGADRATRGMDRLASPVGFRMADRLWRSHQQAVVEFINRYGGVARVDYDNTISQRHNWEDVKNDQSIYDPINQPIWLPVPK
jgi:hypothetical protein